MDAGHPTSGPTRYRRRAKLRWPTAAAQPFTSSLRIRIRHWTWHAANYAEAVPITLLAVAFVSIWIAASLIIDGWIR